jgi:hypothetical protein
MTSAADQQPVCGNGMPRTEHLAARQKVSFIINCLQRFTFTVMYIKRVWAELRYCSLIKKM